MNLDLMLELYTNLYTVHHSAAILMNAREGVSLEMGSLRVMRPSPHGQRISQTYERIRGYIVKGKLAPGARIIESEVAKRLGVSRTPVRSALHQLMNDGYVRSVAEGVNTRLIVAPLTMGDATELYGIVAALEALAAKQAAELDAVRRDQLVQELRRVNDALLRLADTDPLEADAVYDIHTEFHWRIVAALSAPRIQALHQSIKPQAERYRRIYSAASPVNIRASCEEHDVIMDAIQSGDAEAAEHAVKVNWRNSAARVSRLIESSGELGSWWSDSG
jgi:DNA-binding GntR family transcriptional regulator